MKWLILLSIATCSTFMLNAQPEVKMQTGHTAGVNSAVFSSDGKYILSCAKDNEIKLWDVASGHEIRTFKGHTDHVNTIAFAADERYAISSSRDVTIKVWEVATGRIVRDIKMGIGTEAIFSPDKSFAFVKSMENYKIFNLNTGVEVLSFKGKKSMDYSITYSPDGKTIAITFFDRTITFFNARTGAEIRTLGPYQSQPTSIAYAHDGKNIIVGFENSTIKLMDVYGQEIRTYTGHTQSILNLSFSPDSRTFLTASEDSTMRLWDVNSSKAIRTFKGHKWWVYSATFSPNGQTALSTSKDQTMKLWDIKTGNEIRSFSNYSSFVAQIDISTDGNYALSASDKTIKLWDIKTNRVIKVFKGHTDFVKTAQFISGGKKILSGSRDNTLKVWDIQTGKLLVTMKGHTDRVTCSSVSPDGNYALSGSWDKTVRLWDVATGKELYSFKFNSELLGVSFSPDGRNALISDSNIISLWDIGPKTKIRDFEACYGTPISVKFSPDGKSCFASSIYRLVIYDVNTGKVTKNLGNDHLVYYLTYSADGLRALTASDRTIKLWDMATNQLIKTFEGHRGSVSAIRFTPDGKHFFSGSEDGSIKYWDANTCECLYTSMATSDGDYLCWTDEGYFSGTQKLAKEAVYVVDGMNIYSIDQLFEKYYRPDLVATKAMSESISKYTTGNIGKDFKRPPLVTILSPINGATASGSSAKVVVEATDQGGGIDEILLYHNGKLVETSQRGFKTLAQVNEKRSKTFTIELVPGTNEFKATAFNTERTESTPYSIEVNYSGSQKTTTLYLFVVGINKYKNATYNLNYALDDATALKQKISEVGGGIYKDIKIYELYDENSTKQNIQSTISKIQKTADVNDMFLFFYAGHGVMSEPEGNTQPMFYLIPHDVVKMYGSNDMLTDKGVSAQELRDWCKDIKAQKQVLLLDACQSGGAVSTFAMRGAAEEKAVMQLGRSAGIVVLSSTGTEQFATEFKQLGHGVFTYAILEGLIGKADGGSMDKKITIKELESFVNDYIPELSQQYRGEAQYPNSYSTGMDFPVGIVK